MRRPQFTLRALLVAMLVVGAFFGGMAVQRQVAGYKATAREQALLETERTLRLELRARIGQIRAQDRVIESMEANGIKPATPK